MEDVIGVLETAQERSAWSRWSNIGESTRAIGLSRRLDHDLVNKEGKISREHMKRVVMNQC